jgi:hypothetical protein
VTVPSWRFRAAVFAAVAGIGLAACSSAGAGPQPSGSSSASASASVTAPFTAPASASSSRIVTVPGLSSGPATDSTPAADTAGPSPTTHRHSGPSAPTGTSPLTRQTSGIPQAPSTTAGGATDPPTPDPATSPGGVSQPGTGDGGGHVTAGTSAGRPGPSTSAKPAGTVIVDLSKCAGCTVIATHRNVTGNLSAALVSTSKGAVLLSVRPDGSPAGIINVPYGVSFPAPAAGTLPCDSASRCVVTGRQPDGTAILSAFELGADGAWRDMSGTDAFPSATGQGRAADLDGDGVLEIAVQEATDGRTTWLVFGWSGDRFTVLGCSPASDTLPSAGDLSQDACLS